MNHYTCMEHGTFVDLDHCPECLEENKKGVQFSGAVFVGFLIAALALLMWL